MDAIRVDADEPRTEKLEQLFESEELSSLEEPYLPDDVKSEILDDVERQQRVNIDETRSDGPNDAA